MNVIPRRAAARTALVLLTLICVMAPRTALTQTLSTSDPGFWVVLPNGARVPYNHPLAQGTPQPSAPGPATQPAAPSPQPSTSPVLSTSDPGFWVTLPSGAVVPYNHPDALAVAQPIDTGVTGGPTIVSPSPGPVLYAGLQMRVLQWNLHHGVGTEGLYDIGRLASWMAAMKPDVIMLNEVEKNTSWGNEDQPARYEAMLEAKTGRNWYSVFAQEFGAWTASGKGHLILSTYPIEATDRTVISYDRVISSARIVVNGRAISLISTHLDPDSSTRRLIQAQEVTRWTAGQPQNRILAGDMNAWPDQTSVLELYTAYTDSWTAAANKGAAYGFSGLAPDGATKNGRIDYILYSRNAGDLVVVDSRVYDTRDSRGVMPSDHRPVVTTFQVR